MILTDKILNEGKSSKGGWSKKQLSLFGVKDFAKGWKKEILNKDYPKELIDRFIQLKDEHFNTI